MENIDVMNAFVNDNEQNVVDGLFAIASAIHYLADVIGQAPLKDLNEALRDIASATGARE